MARHVFVTARPAPIPRWLEAFPDAQLIVNVQGDEPEMTAEPLSTLVRGMLGAENRRGMGRVVIAAEGLPDPSPYDAFLSERKADILRYLESVGALVDLAA